MLSKKNLTNVLLAELKSSFEFMIEILVICGGAFLIALLLSSTSLL
jgi:hypothetical protein